MIAFLEPTTREIDILGTDSVCDLVDTDAELRQFLLVDAYLDFIFKATADFYCGSPLLRLEIGLDTVFREASKCFETCLRGGTVSPVSLLLEQPNTYDWLGRGIETEQ